MQQQNLIKIRATQDGVSIVCDPQAPLADLLSALNTRLQSHAQFYKNADLKLNLGTRVLQPDELAGIRSMLEAFQLRLSGIVCDEQAVFERFKQDYGCPVEIVSADPSRRQPEAQTPEANGTSDPPHAGAGNEETLFVKQPCRSGMTVSSPGNIIILGNVNPGAEVTAEGDIIVMGVLRGNAHAGASGNTAAVIIALTLDPKRIRIADRLALPPNAEDAPDDPSSAGNTPEIAYIEGSQIIIEPYTGRFPSG